MKMQHKRKIITVVLFLVFINFLAGCAPRLPERSKLMSPLPNLAEKKARVFFFSGDLYMKGAFGGISKHVIKGIDGNIYIEGQKISYINDKDIVVVDLKEGSYSVYWKPHMNEIDEGYHKALPYILAIREGDIRFLKANMRDTASATSKWFGAIGALSGMGWADYIEEDKDQGKKALQERRIVEYHDLSDKIIGRPFTDRIINVGDKHYKEYSELKALKEEGILSKEEFELKNKQLLEAK